jgi:hypothetical protein
MSVLPNFVLNADETLASLGLSRVNTGTLGGRERALVTSSAARETSLVPRWLCVYT